MCVGHRKCLQRFLTWCSRATCHCQLYHQLHIVDAFAILLNQMTYKVCFVAIWPTLGKWFQVNHSLCSSTKKWNCSHKLSILQIKQHPLPNCQYYPAYSKQHHSSQSTTYSLEHLKVYFVIKWNNCSFLPNHKFWLGYWSVFVRISLLFIQSGICHHCFEL